MVIRSDFQDQCLENEGVHITYSSASSLLDFSLPNVSHKSNLSSISLDCSTLELYFYCTSPRVKAFNEFRGSNVKCFFFEGWNILISLSIKMKNHLPIRIFFDKICPLLLFCSVNLTALDQEEKVKR